MKYVFFILAALVFYGCTTKDIKPKESISTEKEIVIEHSTAELVIPSIQTYNEIELKDGEVYDLKNVPQNVEYYTKSISSKNILYKIQKEYEKNYFKVWNIKKHPDSLDASRWPFALHKTTNSYGENLQPLSQDFFDKAYKNANFGDYGTKNIRAISLQETNIRAFPTLKPLFRDPSLAGEGYPFDYLQNSTVHANKPLFISHYSKDKEWAFVFTSFTSGWVKSNEIVILNSKYTDMWQKAQQISIIKENVPIYDMNGNFLFKSKVGMMFALVDEDTSTYTILSVSAYKNLKPLFLKSIISKNIAHKGALKLNSDNLSMILKEVSQTHYGWGGLYEQRDCSSMLRDFYAPFGIWLPRNSSKQAAVGKVIKLDSLSESEKVSIIKENATPFETLLYKKGHVMLYVGTYKDKVIIFHNIWGIKTKKDDIEGRIIIGKPIFSTLELGKYQKYYDKDAKLLKKIKSINILTR